MNNVNDALEPEKKQTILLAEDDPDQSDSLREVLENEGYVVEAVSSGDMALLRLGSHRYCAAIIDARMPGLHGGTVLKVCRLRSPQVTTPIIMVSAFASPRDLDKFCKDGACASFTKPLDVPEVLKCVRRLADDAAQKSPAIPQSASATSVVPELRRAERDVPRIDNGPSAAASHSCGRNTCSGNLSAHGRCRTVYG